MSLPEVAPAQCGYQISVASNRYFGSSSVNGSSERRHPLILGLGLAIAAAARRPSDLVARYGGEEFAVLLPNTSLEGVTGVAAVIQAHIKALQLPHQHSDINPYVTASFGIANWVAEATLELNEPQQRMKSTS